MTPEQLTEAVRKHAKTVLMPSVAQAIVEELTHEQVEIDRCKAEVDRCTAEIKQRALDMQNMELAAERDVLREFADLLGWTDEMVRREVAITRALLAKEPK